MKAKTQRGLQPAGIGVPRLIRVCRIKGDKLRLVLIQRPYAGGSVLPACGLWRTLAFFLAEGCLSMCRSMLALGGAVAALLLASPVMAAELAVPHGAYARNPAACGPCGCLTVKYVYHRVIESTYGASFDPRNFDTTEPHFYLGATRRFPRYFVNGVPAGGPCRGW